MAEHSQDVAGISPLPSLKRRLLSGSAWAFGGKVATILAQLACNAVLARLLTPQDLGAYFLAFSVVMVGAVAGALGLNQAIVRFIAENIGLNRPGRTRRMVVSMLKVGALGALGIGFLYALYGGVLVERIFHSPALVAVTGLVAGWMATMTLQLLLSETFRGFHDVRSATIFGGLVSWTVLAACLGLLWLLKEQSSLAVVMLLAIGSGLTSSLAAGWILSRRIAQLPSRSAEDHVGFSEVFSVAWPLLLTNLTLLALTQVDLWILGAFRPQEEVAIYGAAARMVLLLAMPLVTVNAVVPPLVAEMYAQGRKRELERMLRAMVMLALIPALIALVGFMLFASPILGAVYGDFYRQGAVVLVLLSLGYMVNVWAGPCGTTLAMTGHQATMMLITVLSGLFTLGGALGVVQEYGAVGVASVAAAGMSFQNVLALFLARKHTGLWTHASFSMLPIKEIFKGERT